MTYCPICYAEKALEHLRKLTDCPPASPNYPLILGSLRAFLGMAVRGAHAHHVPELCSQHTRPLEQRTGEPK